MTVITSTAGDDAGIAFHEGTLIYTAHLYNALPPSMHRPKAHMHMHVSTDGIYSTASSQPMHRRIHSTDATGKKIRQTPQANTLYMHYTTAATPPPQFSTTQDVQHLPGSRAGPTLHGPVPIADTQE